jgi:hypothetical protein
MKKLAVSMSIVFVFSLLFIGVAAAEQAAMEGDYVHASKIMDKKVKNDEDKELGSIKELIFSKEGELSYLVMSEGENGDMIPVPFAAVKDDFQVKEDNIVISGLTEDQIKNAPKFSENELAELRKGDQQDERVHGYFGESTQTMPEAFEQDRPEGLEQQDQPGALEQDQGLEQQPYGTTPE